MLVRLTLDQKSMDQILGANLAMHANVDAHCLTLFERRHV